MASLDEREKVIRQLLLAGQLHADPGKASTAYDIPDSATIGFHSLTVSFLQSVYTQVTEKNFITGKQFDVAQRLMSHPDMQYQFSLGLQLPPIPSNFRWVNFENEDIPLVHKLDTPSREPDLRDGGARTFQVGGLTLDLTEEISQPWGVLKVDGDELVFDPKRYPTTSIKQAKFRWDASNKVWRHKGVHLETVEKVVELFGEVLLDESVDKALAQSQELVELPEEIADHGTLFQFQKEATQFLLSHPKCLLALAPGLGKSPTSIIAGKQLLDEGKVRSIGIVAPKSLLKTWQDEIEKWADDWSCILHSDFKNQPLDANWYLVNYAALSRNTLPEEMADVDLVIFDESVLLSTHNRAQKTIDGKRRWVFKTNRVQSAFEIAQGIDWVWLLSGGPTRKFVDDLWAQLHIIDPKRFSSYWRFAESYCHIEHTPWAKQVSGNQPNAIRDIHRHYSDIIFARSQDQVLDLPDWIFEDIDIPMARKQELLYNEMASQWMATLETSGGEIKLFAPNVLAQVTRLTQIASNPILLGHGISAISPKWDAVIELLEVRPLPAIVWTRFVETAKRMDHHLSRAGYKVGLLIGDTPAEIRSDIVKAFQGGQLDIIVAHPKVGKFGLTLTEARTSIYLENSYDGDDYYQSLHRVRRIGTKHSPLVIRLRSIHSDGTPTIDHLITDVLEAKADTTFKMTAADIKTKI